MGRTVVTGLVFMDFYSSPNWVYGGLEVAELHVCHGRPCLVQGWRGPPAMAWLF